MIKFFRQIRQRLLIENRPNGKAGRYLFYAIGEIALVVIGILIALGINDWNENKKNETIIKNNTVLLIESLVADSIYIVNRKLAIQKDLAVVNSIKKRATMPKVEVDTLIKIARDEYTARIYGVVFSNQTTFNTMVVSGEINLFDKELIQEIYNIYRWQDMTKLAWDNSFQRYAEALRDYRRRYTFNGPATIVPKGPLYDKIWNAIDEVDFIVKFNTMAGTKILVYNQTRSQMDIVQNRINELLPKLRKILAND
ncbi:MAG: DUF6090 family protein [Eudoraea sp.]|uniref:DUF6090 family protein n=1 Tax=Eudoraea sp. TaxID=1979955 RepID=UPI003C7428BB